MQVYLQYQPTMDVETWKSQLRKGAAELAVLALLDTGARSGIGLLDALADRPAIGLSDGSIYPLLNRLEREGRIAGQWETPKGGGRGQKIYSLTAEGAAALRSMRSAWTGFRNDLTAIVGERR
ncbi:MAG: PadR family transcriptional regulator [Parvularculaceae bacterium]|nr:PadR family transcriptional regulator [Parvularculaceae bacterium]